MPISKYRLSYLKIRGLFGRFDYEISFSNPEDITIIIAPNGYGKTAVLKIINAIFSKKLLSLYRMEFTQIFLQLSPDCYIDIVDEQQDLFTRPRAENYQRHISVKTKGFGADAEIYRLRKQIPPRILRQIERTLPIERVSSDIWIDYRNNEKISIEDVIDRFGDQLPDIDIDNFKMPVWLVNALSSIESHLIETQRLLQIEVSEEPRPYYASRRQPPSSVVESDAKDLVSRITQVVQEYASVSQKLDQTFPRRIIGRNDGSIESEENIKERLKQINDKRDSLVSVGLIGQAVSSPIRPDETFVDDSVRKILSIYIEDTSTKLGVFDEIFNKIQIFKKIIDNRFSFKELIIDPSDGMQARDVDTGQIIPLSELSSGEQHELVLMYELLFKVSSGSTILIDEPELSLHVGWQRRFISDIMLIQRARNLKIIIATHSPQIINDRWDLVVDLSEKQ